MRLTFHGAAGEVTGSCYLVEAEGLRFLVDCGMFQGGRDARRKNLQALSFDLRHLDFILLTHAHIDHSGLLPRAAFLGFRGPVYATPATADLLAVMLLDAAHIQEKEAEWSERRARAGRRRDRGAVLPPLYTVAQAQASLALLRRTEYGRIFRPHARVRACLRDAGHILGSAIIEVWVDEAGATRKLVFSGDLGMSGRPVLRDPEPVEAADALLVESTYGDRLHKSLEATEDELVEAIDDTLRRRRGNVVMPAFSVGRTQEILFVLADLVRRGRLGSLDVYVDSPMSMAATEITLRHPELLDEQAHALLEWQRAQPQALRVRFVHEVEDSIALNRIRGGAVILSASGMCDAGRIKYHLLNNLGRSECAVIITGFQAAGTLGRRLVDGARSVTLFGESVPVRATIHTIGGLSAHADQEGLLDWLRHFRRPPRQTFVVHGEAQVAASFAEAVARRLSWNNVVVPQHGGSFEII
ncbi:MAG TPA: MBL fold metallo-hydrolase [Candidatus Desulfobacillus sp.]|nr:MBL fold metallo-hydrolase [Candidatus Desulfobacillus sp.]